MLSIISPTTDTSKEKPRFLREKFVIRETDKRKKVIEFESDQTLLFINQDPKEVSGSRAPALKNAGLQDRKFGTLELQSTAYYLYCVLPTASGQ